MCAVFIVCSEIPVRYPFYRVVLCISVNAAWVAVSYWAGRYAFGRPYRNIYDRYILCGRKPDAVATDLHDGGKR